MSLNNKAFARDIRRMLANGQYEKTGDGVYFGDAHGFGRGHYVDRVIRGGQIIEFGGTKNQISDQGFLDMLNTYFGATAKKAGFYLGLYSGAVTPAAGWTAANWVATASEITSTTEGYTGASRPTFVAGAAAANAIDNYASKAAFAIVTASVLTVNGVVLVSEQARGSGSGILYSGARYPNARELQNGDAYEVGFRNSFSAA